MTSANDNIGRIEPELGLKRTSLEVGLVVNNAKALANPSLQALMLAEPQTQSPKDLTECLFSRLKRNLLPKLHRLEKPICKVQRELKLH